MSFIFPLPPREPFERELRDVIFDRGDQKMLAGYLRIDQARISRQLSPDDANCVSPSFQFLQWCWGVDASGNFERTNRMIAQIQREIRKWRIGAVPVTETAPELTVRIFEAATDFFKTESSDSDVETQLNKLDLILQAVERKKDLLNAEKRQKQGAYSQHR